MFERNCLKCNKTKTFKTKRGFDIAKERNSLCGSCSHIGKNHPMYGKCHSKHAIEKMRMAKLGNKNPNKRSDVRNKISENRRGKCMGNKNPNWRPRGKEYTKWQEYKFTVRQITRQQPLHLLENFDKRGKCKYHLDHKISIYDGFKKHISVNVIGNISNLQMLWWKDNLRKNKNSV